jgi:hypothetical protein
VKRSMNWLALATSLLVGGCAGCLKKPAPARSQAPKVAVTASAPAPEPVRRIRHAQIAGSWYPDNKEQLAAQVDALFAAAKPAKVDGQVTALISPHAGYRFCA